MVFLGSSLTVKGLMKSHLSRASHSTFGPPRYEQTFELFTFPGTQQIDRISSVALSEFKCLDSAIRRLALIGVVQGCHSH